jgi:lysophospholipase L1-like esterase
VKSVLCYGDSNTWGAATVARIDGRYGEGERWPGVLRAELGADWLVIEEGLPGRTTVSDDPVEGSDRNGRSYLRPCLSSHRPLDLVIIMLGTNDLKVRFNKPAYEIAAGVGALVDDVSAAGAGREGQAPRILVIAPPPIRDDLKDYTEMFAGAQEKSLQLAGAFAKMAEARQVHFLDAGTLIRSSEVDGFHLDPDAHAVLGRAVADRVRQVLA